MEELSYPIGRFKPVLNFDSEARQNWIREIELLPDMIRNAVQGLSDEQLDTPYRPEGWTIRQVVHHLADSHLNGYTRFRLTLTEETPTITTYDQRAWAELSDARTAPVGPSLDLLTATHIRWTLLLKELSNGDFSRKMRHPEWGEVDLNINVQLYSWHGRHHLTHIKNLRRQEGWG